MPMPPLSSDTGKLASGNENKSFDRISSGRENGRNSIYLINPSLRHGRASGKVGVEFDCRPNLVVFVFLA